VGVESQTSFVDGTFDAPLVGRNERTVTTIRMRFLRIHRRAIVFAIRLTLSCALLAVLFNELGSAEILQTLARAKLELLLLATFVLIGQTALSTLKWLILLLRQGVQSVAYLPLLKIYLISNFINLFMPSILVGDAYRVARLRRYTENLQGALPSIIVDRASGLAALIVLGTVGLLTLYSPRHLFIGTAALIVGVVGLYLTIVGPIAKRVSNGAAIKQSRLSSVLAQVCHALRPSVALVGIVAISFAFHVNTVVINWIYCLALGIPVSFTQLLTAVPAVYVLEALPISINGIGVRESAFAVLFDQMQLAPVHGVALGVTVSVMRYVAGVVGGLLLVVDALRARAVD
jgi:uncharacterized protein (TIRG00374 family)